MVNNQARRLVPGWNCSMWVSARTIVSCTRSSARSVEAVSETAKARRRGTVARISPRSAEVKGPVLDFLGEGFDRLGIRSISNSAPPLATCECHGASNFADGHPAPSATRIRRLNLRPSHWFLSRITDIQALRAHCPRRAGAGRRASSEPRTDQRLTNLWEPFEVAVRRAVLMQEGDRSSRQRCATETSW